MARVCLKSVLLCFAIVTCAYGEWKTLDGFIYHQPSDFLFKVFAQKLNRSSAHDICVSAGGFLVRIDSKSKQDALQTYLYNITDKEGIEGLLVTAHYLIDAEKMPSGQWVFESGTTITETYFSSPLILGLNTLGCAYLDSQTFDPFQWTMVPCSTIESFICEFTPGCLGSPPSITHASIDFKSRSIGSQAQYSCTENTVTLTNGNNNFTECLVNRSWSIPEMQCIIGGSNKSDNCTEGTTSKDLTCVCLSKTTLTSSQLALRIKQIKENLLLDKTQTTQRKIKKYSARDDRVSSISLGLIFGVGVLATSVIAIVVSDTNVIYKDIRYGFRSLSERRHSMPP